MPDNVQLPVTGTGTADIRVTTRKVTYSGDADTDFQVVGLGVLAGSDDAKTVTDVGPTSAASLPTKVIGGDTNTSSQVTVTNTSTSIVAADADRRGVQLINYQTVAIYFDPAGGTATTSNARLDPGAGIYLPVTTAITGITSAAYSASGDLKVHVITVA